MGQYRIPGPDCTLEGTARITDVAEGYCAPSATWSERVQAGSDFTPEEREMILDVSQALLDLLGIVDQTGLSDLTNAAISFNRDDYIGGWIGIIAIVPVLGDVAKIPRIATHIAKIKRAMNRAKQSSRLYAAIAPSLHALSSVLDKLNNLSGQVGKMAREINEPIRAFLGKTTSIAGKLMGRAVDNAHKAAIKKVAKKHGIFILMRNVNEKSLQWIAKGFPSKGLSIKPNTDADGLVRYLGNEIDTLKKGTNKISVEKIDGKDVQVMDMGKLSPELDDIFSSGYGMLVNKNGNWVVYFEDYATKEITHKPYFAKEFTPADGHVIHMQMGLPVTADYDLFAIIKPDDLSINRTTFRTGEGNPVAGSITKTSASNDFDNQIIEELNSAMGQPRILHGADERFWALRTKKFEDDVVTVFFPDGKNDEPYERMSDDFLHFMQKYRVYDVK